MNKFSYIFSVGILLCITLPAVTCYPQSFTVTAISKPSGQQTNALSIKTALILNPSEYMYGDLHCKKIQQNLENIGFTVIYQADDTVDIEYLKQELDVDVVYFNTHAGYWDTDGDAQPDTMVVATGEHWTNETETKYSFEIAQHMVVKGVIAENEFVCLTPTFIEYYYTNQSFPESLIYMATCEAAYDTSLADVFLSNGAETYIGWSGSTMFWTNSITSVLAFSLFSHGWSVQQVTKLIRYGGVYNRMLRSKLTYFGNGELVITTRT